MTSATTKVVLADDDPAILRLLSHYVKKAGHDVIAVKDGKEALAAVAAEMPQFLITDWDMPELNGIELCRAVRELDLPHYVYIIFLTAKSRADDLVVGLDAGADDFLTKPVNRHELLARMHAGERILTLERQLNEIARTDPLTGLFTRRAFFDIFQREWDRAARHPLPFSCVMLDIDFFKRVNDNHGHPAGDLVIKKVADLLTSCCRASDTVCRYGGEEFCILLPETTEHDAIKWAERVRLRLAQSSVTVGDKQLHMTISLGVAERYDDTRSVEELINQADEALLCAKQTGRNRVVSFNSMSNPDQVDVGKATQFHDLFEGIQARHVMVPTVACLNDNETVGHAAEFFLRSRLSSSPVVDSGGKLVGILSEKDLMAAMTSLECWNRPVHELMKPDVICYEEETPVRAIYEFLCRVSIRRVVIAKEGRPTGAVGRGTLLRWFRNLVISKGLVDRPEFATGKYDIDPHRSRERLNETAGELSQQASDLQDRFQEDVDDLVPHVVGGATRIQELVNDLLAYSRFANQSARGIPQAMLAEIGHSE